MLGSPGPCPPSPLAGLRRHNIYSDNIHCSSSGSILQRAVVVRVVQQHEKNASPPIYRCISVKKRSYVCMNTRLQLLYRFRPRTSDEWYVRHEYVLTWYCWYGVPGTPEYIISYHASYFGPRAAKPSQHPRISGTHALGRSSEKGQLNAEPTKT